MRKKYLNISKKYGERCLITLKAYQELNPSGEFYITAGAIWEKIDGKSERVATYYFKPSDFLPEEPKRPLLLLADLVWVASEDADENLPGFVGMMEALAGYATEKNDKDILCYFAGQLQEVLDEWAAE